jgi:hypothetical protein
VVVDVFAHDLLEEPVELAEVTEDDVATFVPRKALRIDLRGRVAPRALRSFHDDEVAVAQAIENAPEFGAQVITIHGDQVVPWETREAVLALLGEIDSPEAARILVTFDGDWVACNDVGSGGVRAVNDGFEVVVTRTQNCNPYLETRFVLHVARDGTVSQLASEELVRRPDFCVTIGRRPEGLEHGIAAGGTHALGAFFGDMAMLEAASVYAFEIIARELEAFGAPKDLIAQARLAAADEVRHAEVVSGLARMFGAVPGQPEVASRPLRNLHAFALDNAVEGCVRETFGALLAAYQAQQADHAAVRAALAAPRRCRPT